MIDCHISFESNFAEQVISGFADRAIRYKARQLAGRHGFSLSEREDLEQEFRLLLLRRLASFDPHVAHWNVFVRTLLERHAATLIEQRRVRAQAQEAVEAPAEFYEAPLDLVIDTEEILARLPDHDRTLCEKLKIDPVAEVARQLNMPRSTLRDALARLREPFSAAAQNNFRNSSATSSFSPVGN
jgi:RNA polymerase sigma-70 factor (ECF subfamily)